MNIDDIIQKLTDESESYVYIIPIDKNRKRAFENIYVIKNVINNRVIALTLDDKGMITVENNNISNELKELIKRINLHMLLLE